jgi:preprotein translocase subunit SecF
MLGGPTIRLFVTALAAGFLVGTYSSLFNAACVVVSWDQSDGPRLWKSLGRLIRIEQN